MQSLADDIFRQISPIRAQARVGAFFQQTVTGHDAGR
jgi:hypothetical protein